MENVADVVEQLTSAQAAGFDLRGKQPELLAIEAVKRFAAKSHWVKAELTLGPTVAAQTVYTLPGQVVKLLDLLYGESTPYQAKSIRDLWDLKSGRAELVESEYLGGIFAERFSADGTLKQFEIFPAPEEGGEALTGLASIVPPDITLETALPFPEDKRRAVVDLAKAIAYEDTDEGFEPATYFEKRANAEAESLFLLGNARIGSGPYKIPVAGHRRR
jgi:hypothetical protein